jgi:hypothetical protein
LAARKQRLSWLQANMLASLAQGDVQDFDRDVEYDLRFQLAESRYVLKLAKARARRLSYSATPETRRLEAEVTKLQKQPDQSYALQVNFSPAVLTMGEPDPPPAGGDIDALHPHHPLRFKATAHAIAGQPLSLIISLSLIFSSQSRCRPQGHVQRSFCCKDSTLHVELRNSVYALAHSVHMLSLTLTCLCVCSQKQVPPPRRRPDCCPRGLSSCGLLLF